MSYQGLFGSGRIIFSPKIFNCQISYMGESKFAELFNFLVEKEFKCIDKESCIFQNRAGFKICIGSSGGGDSWVVSFSDEFNRPMSYWKIDSLRKRIESPVPLTKIK